MTKRYRTGFNSLLDDVAANHMPSRQEITAACARFQATWSPEERERRRGVIEPLHWTPPLVKIVPLEEVASE